MMWQWNNQLPSRSGVHAIVIVEPDRNKCVTTGWRCASFHRLVSRPVADALDVKVEPVQMHWVMLRTEVDDAPTDPLAALNR